MYIRRKIFSLHVNSKIEEQKEFTRADYEGLDSTSSAKLKSERSKISRKLLRDKKSIKRSYRSSTGTDGVMKEQYDSPQEPVWIQVATGILGWLNAGIPSPPTYAASFVGTGTATVIKITVS